MTSSTVALNRRFIPWTEKDHGDPDIYYLLGSDRLLTWQDVLSKRRIVILAEAGSGKSTEMQEEARRLRAQQKVSFLATLQNVAISGLDGALHVTRKALNEWRNSKEPAWFFLDSVDEAKSNHIRLYDALTQVASGIAGCEARAYIVISGRHTDWEFRRDLEHFATLLALPPADKEIQPIDPNELIVRLIRHDKQQDSLETAEVPSVVVMAALSRPQVQTFVRAKGIAEVDEFLVSLDNADLWRFARRPLDLGWLVDFWRTRHQFGTYSQMLKLSLRQRLREPDPQRARIDPLDPDRAWAALERTGAALTLQKLEYVLVPDTVMDLTEARTGLKLTEVLPEWSDQDVTRLINRPVFDPVVAGLVRLHHDNEGDVRSYLTARWFKRLLQNNCPKTAIVDLMFATTHGVQLVIPSMRQTAAWLALWDEDIAREVIDRDPRLLMNAGDPASLTLAVRERVLHAVANLVLHDDNFEVPSHDHLQRFARPDVSPAIHAIWNLHEDSPAVRNLLLFMIWLGELEACSDIAMKASFGVYADQYSQVFSGRALMAVASPAEKTRYASYIKANAREVSPTLVWEAVEEFFPQLISVDDLLQLIAQLDIEHPSNSRFDQLGPKLPERLTAIPLLERLASALIAMLNREDDSDGDNQDSIFATIEATAKRILELLPAAHISAVAIEAVLICRQRDRHRRREEVLVSLLYATPERRRATLWFAVAWFAGYRGLHDHVVTGMWQFHVMGFPPQFRVEDVGWLIEDTQSRSTAHERRLAADAVLTLWRQHGAGEVPLDRLREVAQSRPEVAAVIDEWMLPRSASQEERESERELRRIQRRNVVEQAKSEQSWIEFADRIRADPEQLRGLNPPTEKGIDSRLYHLWKLLTSVGENRSHYAIDSLDVLAPVFGPAVLSALRDAFVAFWRHWKPTLHSDRPLNKRNVIQEFDCIGIVGITLEASASRDWTATFTRDDAIRAAGYATLELNGFPAWFSQLAQVQPEAVREVLTQELAPELETTDISVRPDILQDVSHSDNHVGALVSPYLFEVLLRRTTLRLDVMKPMLQVLTTSFAEAPGLARHLSERVERTSDHAELACYFEHLFTLMPAHAHGVFKRKLASLANSEQTQLVQAVLPRLCGDRFGKSSGVLGTIPFETLKRLLKIAYRTIRIEDDNDHSQGGSYTPDERDDAESARSALFRTFVDTPGLATFQAIQRLRKDTTFPISEKRLSTLAVQRAGSDSEYAAWASADVYRFESDQLALPRNPLDLQRLAIRKLTTMQHDLLHADFAQGSTLAREPAEVGVQNWIANHLRANQGRSYSVEREPHVADEKEPDVRFRAKASDASVAMEIKVAEEWSLIDLENALSDQLVRRYLRDRHNRYGILLLVHQKSRRKGWRSRNGQWLAIAQVLNHLRRRALVIGSREPYAPQAAVILIDVSSAGSRQQPRASLKSSTEHKRPEPKRTSPMLRKQPKTQRSKGTQVRKQRRPVSQ